MFKAVWPIVPHSIRHRISCLHQRLIRESLFNLPSCETVTYVNSNDLISVFPNARLVNGSSESSLNVSLILTCKNEAGTFEAFLDSLLSQSFKPVELVICDGGSSDNTIDVINGWHAKNLAPWTLEIISMPGANIALGRNEAIKRATNELIAVTDVGVILETEWFSRLVYPFADDSQIEVSAGWYKMQAANRLHTGLCRFIVPEIDTVDPQSVLPSSRSLAFTKTAWNRAGAYPEYLSFAAEDTLFALSLRTVTRKWAFCPDAQVAWTPPVKGVWKMLFRYARGDGQAGFASKYYLQLVGYYLPIFVDLLFLVPAIALTLIFAYSLTSLLLIGLLLLQFVGLIVGVLRYRPFYKMRAEGTNAFWRLSSAIILVSAQTFGVISGWKSRGEVNKRRRSAASQLIYLELESPISMLSDGFEEYCQQLIDGNYLLVVYTSSPPDIVPMIHPRLEQWPEAEFDFESWKAKNPASSVSENAPGKVRIEA